MLKGFKEFISRGSVIDLAVGVIIGAAFAKVIDALVNNVLMPAIAMIFVPDFDNWLVFGSIKIGVLITAIVNFLLIAAAVYFALVMPMNKMARRKAIKAGIDPEAETPDPQIELLTDIRDALRKTEEADSPGSHRA
ncbi:large conductance mechanosensitive channel protein MscL [Galactobacter sp.]|uniref:large conductance mechanosensitive channel protein MscL n=1 Tax=Galactobacter sp. TaxID=2676125 RepID=UPI0025BB0872|nr:large conductance mechanosensitive channel protein MscL [Galactobacter sp.]